MAGTDLRDILNQRKHSTSNSNSMITTRTVTKPVPNNAYGPIFTNKSVPKHEKPPQQSSSQSSVNTLSNVNSPAKNVMSVKPSTVTSTDTMKVSDPRARPITKPYTEEQLLADNPSEVNSVQSLVINEDEFLLDDFKKITEDEDQEEELDYEEDVEQHDNISIACPNDYDSDEDDDDVEEEVNTKKSARKSVGPSVGEKRKLVDDLEMDSTVKVNKWQNGNQFFKGGHPQRFNIPYQNGHHRPGTEGNDQLQIPRRQAPYVNGNKLGGMTNNVQQTRSGFGHQDGRICFRYRDTGHCDLQRCRFQPCINQNSFPNTIQSAQRSQQSAQQHLMHPHQQQEQPAAQPLNPPQQQQRQSTSHYHQPPLPTIQPQIQQLQHSVSPNQEPPLSLMQLPLLQQRSLLPQLVPPPRFQQHSQQLNQIPLELANPPNELLDELSSDDVDVNRRWNIISHLNDLITKKHVSIKNFDTNSYRRALELTLIKIRENNANPITAEIIAEKILEIKELMFQLKWEDLFYTAGINCKLKNYAQAVSKLRRLYAQFSDVKWDNLKELVEDCIEPRGLILELWYSFKKDAVTSARFIEMLFSKVEYKILNEKLKADDIEDIHKNLLYSQQILSSSAKKVFLKLFTPHSRNNQLIDILSSWSELNCVPVITVESILMSLQHADIKVLLTGLNILKKLPVTICKSASDSLNDLLVIMSKRGDVFYPMVFQYYELMRNQLKIELSTESALRILHLLCCRKEYEVFLSTSEEILTQENVVIPDWFTTTLLESMEICKSHHIVYKMVLLMLTSSIPPPDDKLNDVIDMLISKRQFRNIYDLVKQCFEHRIILSQLVLRRVVYALEEWVTNIHASIYVYTKMREAYPRPEGRSLYDQRTSALDLRRSTSNSYHSSYGHDHLESFSKDMDVDQEEETEEEEDKEEEEGEGEEEEAISATTTESNQRQFIGISANLTACAPHRSLFVDCYLQAINLGGANNDNILTGLFLGISNTDNPGDDFDMFVVLLIDKYDLQNFENYEPSDQLPDDIATAICRLGLRLIKFLHTRQRYDEAFKVLVAFHRHTLRYYACGSSFGTQIETKDNLSLCQIANLCVDVCIRNNSLEDAYNVLISCDYGNDGRVLEEIEEQERNIVVSNLIQGLLQVQNISFAWKIFENVHSSMLKQDKSKLVNDILASYCQLENAEQTLELSQFINEHKLDLHKKSLKMYVNLHTPFTPSEGIQMFVKGLLMGVYDKTYNQEHKFILHITTDLSIVEIGLVFANHMRELSFDVSCDYAGLVHRLGTQLDKIEPFQFVVAPEKDQLDLIEHEPSILHTEIEIVKYAKNISEPALEIIGQRKQCVTISHRSALEWLQNMSNRHLINEIKHAHHLSQMQLFNKPLVPPETPILRPTQQLPQYQTPPHPQVPLTKKKRTIAMAESSGDMTMTICPTPKPFDTSEEDPAPSVEHIESDIPSTRKISRELVRHFPHTTNLIEAKNSIRRVICAQLTHISRISGGVDNIKFHDIARNLNMSFYTLLSARGPVVYNSDICLEAMDYVDQRYLSTD